MSPDKSRVPRMSPDKSRVLRALRARLLAEQQRMQSSQRAAQQGSVHPEARQENPKDTRAIEAGYLARGLAERAEALRTTSEQLGALALRDFSGGEPIGVSALVTLEHTDDGTCVHVFLVPVAGGETLVVDDCEVKPISPSSPLGRALVGRESGDEVLVTTPAGTTRYVVARVD